MIEIKVGCAAIVNAPTKRSFERRELASCLFRKTDQQDTDSIRTRRHDGLGGLIATPPPLDFGEETCVSEEGHCVKEGLDGIL